MKKIAIAAFCLVLSLCGAAFALDVGGVAVHGFVSQGYLKTDDVNYLAETEKGSYQFNEAGLNFNYTRDQLRVGAQVFSRDMGDFGNNDVVLDWAMGEYRIFDELGIRAGRCKIPFGLYNQGRDVDIVRTPIFLPSGVYDESMRDVVNAYNGFGVFGVLDAKILGGFEYEAFIGSLNMDENSLFLQNKSEAVNDSLSSGMGPGITGAASNLDFESKSSGGGILKWETPLPGLRLATNYSLHKLEITSDMTITLTPPAGPPGGLDVPANAWVDAEAEIFVHSAEFVFQGLTVAGEYYHMRVPATDHVESAAIGLDDSSDSVEHEGGWYASASYQFLDWFTAGLYYSEFYNNLDDKDGDRFLNTTTPRSYAWQKEWVPTLRFDPVPNWVIKAEVHFVDGSALCFNFNNPLGREDDWHLYAIKTSYSF